uniref:Uncharacterized protein n=1 Tax=Aegilops tauschii subsp. strangulata TaxID=200361 RepID=A0A453A5N9_AEGTS
VQQSRALLYKVYIVASVSMHGRPTHPCMLIDPHLTCISFSLARVATRKLPASIHHPPARV